MPPSRRSSQSAISCVISPTPPAAPTALAPRALTAPRAPTAPAPGMPDRLEAGGVRALAWIYCPAAQRRLLGALLGIEREIAASVRVGLDHSIAHTRLAWWRAECARTIAGTPSHPMTR